MTLRMAETPDGGIQHIIPLEKEKSRPVTAARASASIEARDVESSLALAARMARLVAAVTVPRAYATNPMLSDIGCHLVITRGCTSKYGKPCKAMLTHASAADVILVNHSALSTRYGLQALAAGDFTA